MDASHEVTDASFACVCQQVFHVHGGGRHRIYFEPADGARSEPVMDRACPSCGRGLPGMGRPTSPGLAARR